MNEVIYTSELDKNNICEVIYFDNIIDILDRQLADYSIIVTTDAKHLPPTKFKKIVFLIGEASWDIGLDVYPLDDTVVAVFRDYCIHGRYDNAKIFPIPSGYNCRSNGFVMNRMYPEKKIFERKYDLFYSGHTLPHREVLIKKLDILEGQYNVFCQSNPGFRSGLNIDDYYALLGDSKICLVPDGTSIDTYRYTEALGSGCLVITTKKPDLWYYRHAPVTFINIWDELTKELVDKVLKDDVDFIQGLIKEYHKACLSEEAVAKYILERLKLINNA